MLLIYKLSTKFYEQTTNESKELCTRFLCSKLFKVLFILTLTSSALYIVRLCVYKHTL